MNYSVENEYLKITVSDIGAELVSVISKADGCEYVWQGDEHFWNGQAPVLFPICCRLFGGYYTYEGNQYFMNCHGFLRKNPCDSAEVGENSITVKLTPNDLTRSQYPFDFELAVKYTLVGKKVCFSATVKNPSDDKTLIFALGGHPGFNAPIDKGSFEDWFLEFDEKAEPEKFCFTDTCFQTGKTEKYPLRDGKILPLRHDLFDHDALFFRNVCHAVTLKSDLSAKSVRVDFPEMNYLGVWHAVKKEAPYVCIEPMNGLPSFDGRVDDLSTKTDTVHLAPGKVYTAGFDMTFN